MQLARLGIASLVTHGRIDLAQIAQSCHIDHALHLLGYDGMRPNALPLDAPLARRDRVAKVFTHLFGCRRRYVFGYIRHLALAHALGDIIEDFAAHVATQLPKVQAHQPSRRLDQLVAIKFAVIGWHQSHRHTA